jgi:hypothetical protein
MLRERIKQINKLEVVHKLQISFMKNVRQEVILLTVTRLYKTYMNEICLVD